MGDRIIGRQNEKVALPQELTFSDVIAMEQSNRSSHTRIRETHHKVSSGEFIDFSESDAVSAVHKPKVAGKDSAIQFEQSLTKADAESRSMKYDAASNSYQTDDGYILPLGAPKIERLSGYELENQLKELAASEKHKDKAGVQPQVNEHRIADNNSLVALPGSELNYGTLAKGLNGRSLYAPPSTSCSETSVSVDAHALGFSGGMTIYDKQNDDCRLAQTVAQSCAIAELISLDVQNAPNAKELMKRSDAVVTATDYCAETIAAVKNEERQSKAEERQAENEELQGKSEELQVKSEELQGERAEQQALSGFSIGQSQEVKHIQVPNVTRESHPSTKQETNHLSAEIGYGSTETNNILGSTSMQTVLEAQ
ncbi:MAG: hypothetical protein WC028_16420 [Candidatus Obscuribacterales bacterium]